MLPVHALALLTGAKSFVDNPVIGSPRLNRHGLHTARVRLAHALARLRRRRLAHRIDPADRFAFDRDGFVEKREFLPAAVFARLRDEIMAYEAPAREMIQGDTITRRIAVDDALLAACPATRTLTRDPRWRGLLRYASSYDSEPLIYIQTILPGHAEGPPDPQTDLHADTFHPTMKAWFFLTDVEPDRGALCYVPGSHHATPARLAWERARSIAAATLDRLSARGSLRISAAEVQDMGLTPARSFAVPANTLIVADMFGFHARGPSSTQSVRVEIWAYSRRNPFLPWTGLDPANLPGIASRRIAWIWAVKDRYSRWFGQPWRDVGRKRPAA